MQFYQSEPAYVKFDYNIPRGASIGVYARRNALPTHTQYHFKEVLSGFNARTTRSTHVSILYSDHIIRIHNTASKHRQTDTHSTHRPGCESLGDAHLVFTKYKFTWRKQNYAYVYHIILYSNSFTMALSIIFGALPLFSRASIIIPLTLLQ